MSSYAGIVYDLDGTLVRLTVDWEQARAEAVEQLHQNGISVDDLSLWDILAYADGKGFEQVVEDVLSAHECAGAKRSEGLPALECLPHSIPTGVCTLNCESACRIALDVHDIGDYIDAVVGRDTVSTHKPAPEPLLETADRLSISPANTLFVGDSERDALTAERAGTDFLYVEDFLESSVEL